jgi:hypothetical protein
MLNTASTDPGRAVPYSVSRDVSRNLCCLRQARLRDLTDILSIHNLQRQRIQRPSSELVWLCLISVNPPLSFPSQNKELVKEHRAPTQSIEGHRVMTSRSRFSSFMALGAWITYIWVPKTQDDTGLSLSLEDLAIKRGLSFWRSYPWRIFVQNEEVEEAVNYPIE